MLKDFSVYNKTGVDAAIMLMNEGFFDMRPLEKITVSDVFDSLAERFEE